MIYERLENCPVCQKTEFRNKLVVEDYTVSHESFAIVQCANCSLLPMLCLHKQQRYGSTKWNTIDSPLVL